MNKVFARLNRHVIDILRGASLAFILKILAAAIAFLVNVVLARLLGSEGVGIYFLSLAVITFASILGRLGTDNLILREVAKEAAFSHWNTVRSRYRACLRVVVYVSIPVTILVIVYADTISTAIFSKPDLTNPLRFMSMAILPLALFNLFANALKGLRKVQEAVTVQNILLPVFMLVCLFLLLSDTNTISASIAYVTAAVLTAVAGGVLWHRALADKPEKQEMEVQVVNIMTSAKPLLVIAILTFGMKWLSTLFLGVWGTAYDIGVFNVAQRTAMLTSFILVAVNTISAPKFAELFQRGDMQGLEATAVNSARLLSIASLPPLLLFLIAPGWVMGLFGEEFSDNGTILTILALGQFINVATGSVAYLLMMTGKEKNMMKIMLFTTAIGFALNGLLVPLMGGVGAAIATAVSMAAQNLIAAVMVYKKLGISTLPFERFIIKNKA